MNMTLQQRLKKRLEKPRFLFAYPLGIGIFWFSGIHERLLPAGCALIALGLAIRLWANGYVGLVKVNNATQGPDGRKIGRLTTAGPYAWVRHPLYLGSFLIGAGFCVSAGNYWAAAAGLVFFLWVYGNKMAEEEALLLQEAGEDYARYHAAIPRWFPSFRRFDRRNGSWTARALWVSRELKTVIWVIAGMIILYFKEEWLRKDLFTPDQAAKHWTLLFLLVLLVAADVGAEIFRRTHKPSVAGAGRPAAV